MGGSYWLLLLVGGASLLSIIHCQASCPRDGAQGKDGAPGRDGLTGSKGQKGEPVEVEQGAMDPLALKKLKGDAGPRGPQGPIGLKGYSGSLGLAGMTGPQGQPGPEGRNLGQRLEAPQKHSAFSVIRTSPVYPSYRQVVMFDRVVVNDPPDFNTDSGEFVCRSPGVYYFTFTAFSKVSMCLSINSQALPNELVFCDYNRNYDQVLSGGVVLQLTVGQKVWLKSYRDYQTDTDTRDRRPKQIIFSGFLLF